MHYALKFNRFRHLVIKSGIFRAASPAPLRIPPPPPPPALINVLTPVPGELCRLISYPDRSQSVRECRSPFRLTVGDLGTRLFCRLLVCSSTMPIFFYSCAKRALPCFCPGSFYSVRLMLSICHSKFTPRHENTHLFPFVFEFLCSLFP